MTAELKTELLEKRTYIEDFLRQSPGGLSAFSFVNIFAWQDHFAFDLKVIEGNLCIFARQDTGTFLYLPPLGKEISRRMVDEVFSIMEERNGGNSVTRVENVPVHQLGIFPPEEFFHYKKGYE